MPSGNADLYYADALSEGIECYLRRNGVRCVSSAAVLEMVLTVLRATGMAAAKAALESRHVARRRLRASLVVHHGGGTRTAWSKDWLVRHGCSQWGLGRAAARILAGEVEQALLRRRTRDVSRSAVIEMLSSRLAEYGLVAGAAATVAVGEA
jgi:hypothetical protein